MLAKYNFNRYKILAKNLIFNTEDNVPPGNLYEKILKQFLFYFASLKSLKKGVKVSRSNFLRFWLPRTVQFCRMELILLTFHVGEAGESVSREQSQQEGFKVYSTVFFFSF